MNLTESRIVTGIDVSVRAEVTGNVQYLLNSSSKSIYILPTIMI